MKTFWMLMILLSNGQVAYVKSHESLQSCRNYATEGEYYPLFLSPVKEQFLDVFCMSNTGVMKSRLGRMA